MRVEFKTLEDGEMYKAYIKVDGKNGVDYKEEFQWEIRSDAIISRQEQIDFVISDGIRRLLTNIENKEGRTISI